MGANPGLRNAGTGTESTHILGAIPYVAPDENEEGNVLEFVSLTEGQFIRSGGDGPPTGVNLFGSFNTWEAQQEFLSTVPGGGIRMRIATEAVGNYQEVNFLAGSSSTISDTTRVAAVSAGIVQAHPDPLKGFLGFKVNTGDSLLDAAIIDSSGHMGIGTTVPFAHLHVRGVDPASPCLRVEAPVGMTADTMQWAYGGASHAAMVLTSSGSHFVFATLQNYGNNIRGPYIGAGRNAGVGAEGGAAGSILYTTGQFAFPFYTWVDGSGLLRIHSSPPTGSTGSPTVGDTAGTAVGSQSSTRDIKEEIVPVYDMLIPLQVVLDASAELYSFKYKNHQLGNKGVFCGLIIDDGPDELATDPDSQYPKGKILNDPAIFGALIGSVRYLHDWLTEVSAAVDADDITALQTLTATHTTQIADVNSGLATIVDQVDGVATTVAGHTTTLAGLANHESRIAAIEAMNLNQTILDLITRIENLESAP